MQRFNMIQGYKRIEEGSSVTFAHPEELVGQARLIKMRLNVPYPVNLWITRMDTIDGITGEFIDEEQTFLAHLNAGFEEIQFFYEGSFSLTALGGDIWLDTFDNASVNVEPTDYSNYARVWEREERDPRLLEIEQAARHNQRIREEQFARDKAQYDEMKAEIQRMKDELTLVSGPSNRKDGAASPSAQQTSQASGNSGEVQTGTGPTEGGISNAEQKTGK